MTARTTKNIRKTRHTKEAGVLAELFSTLSVQLAAGDVATARSASHQAHALLEVLAAMDAQEEHPELESPKCEERQQASQAWKQLMRPTEETSRKLRNHFEDRRFSYIRVQPLPTLPEPKPRETYKGGIYQTVFLPDDPKLAKELGLPESYTFRHGVTNSGFKLSLHWAIERKVQALNRHDLRVEGRLENPGWAFNTLRVSRPKVNFHDEVREVRYSIHSTTHAETAAQLAVERGGKKPKATAKLR